MLLANLAIIGYLFTAQTAGDQVRRQLRSKLQAHYSHLDVQIRAGRLDKDGLLVLEGVEFWTRPHRQERTGRALLRIGRLDIYTNVQIEKVLAGQMPVQATRIVAHDLTADVWKLPDGSWSPELLWPPLPVEESCPQIDLVNGRVRLHGNSDSIRPLELHEIDAQMVLAATATAVTTMPGGVSDEAAGNESNRQAQFQLQATAAFVDSLLVQGELIGGQWTLRGEANKLRMDHRLVEQLPVEPAAWLNDFRSFETQSDVQLAVTVSASDWLNPVYRVDCSVHAGRLEHQQLPLPLERLAGQMVFHPQGCEVHWGKAQFGEADLRVVGTMAGWGADATASGRLTADGLLVNERLAQKLPPEMEAAWNRIRPSGPVDIELQWQRQGGHWSSAGNANLRGVDIQPELFPYPVHQLVGSLAFDHQRVTTAGLTGRVGGQTIQIAFDQAIGSSTDAEWLQMAVSGPVAIDSPLLSALTQTGDPTSELETFMRSLAPSGGVHLVAARFERDAAGEMRQSLDLRISGGALRYQPFPYPLYDVRGQVTIHDDWVQLIGFQASNSDNAKIRCDGSFLRMPDGMPHPEDGQWQLALNFLAQELPLDESLRAALSVETREQWDQFSPTGVIEQATVRLHNADRWAEPKIVITAQQSSRPTIDNRTISLRSAAVPYRLDIVEGAVRFDGNEVRIESLDGRHDSTRIAADGTCRRSETGQWRMDLNVHSGSRLHPDAELIGSLPAEVRGLFQRLQLRGPLSVRGTLGMELPDARQPEPVVDWDFNIQLEGNRIGDVGPVRDLRGEIAVRGVRDGDTVTAEGDIRIDSMHIQQQQVTAIVGPFGVRNDRLYLGESLAKMTDSVQTVRSGKRQRQPMPAGQAVPVRGQVFGGSASLSGEIVLSSGEFDVVASLADADLGTVVNRLGQTDTDIRGVAQGQIRLDGVLGAPHLLKGAGSATLAQANLYQLPMLISVFNIARVKPSEAVAFTDGAARFTLYGDTVTFNELRLWGDLIALDGNGTLNRAQEVDLLFNTRVSPQNVWSWVTQPFGETNYTLMTLNVRGPLASAQVERRGIETVGGNLERLLPVVPGLAERFDQRPVQSGFQSLRERLW